MELTLVALHLAASEGSYLPQSARLKVGETRAKFPDALQLLADAEKFISEGNKSRPLGDLSHNEAAAIFDIPNKATWTFQEATEGKAAPLSRLWKSRQGLEQAINRFATKSELGLAQKAAVWLKTRTLTESDLDLIVRACKVERCGRLDQKDSASTRAEIIETIPQRKRLSQKKR